MNRPIVLLTDFGTEDHYVASLKGVILSINPKAQMIDMSHDIAPQAIYEAAFVLGNCFHLFPKGSIFVVVVDPGVGGKRREICVRTGHYYFMGPDNGVFSVALSREKKFEARALENDRYFRKPISNTFHGRDMFSPAAAHLSTKNIFASLGKKVARVNRFSIPKSKVSRSGIQGKVVYVDRFGNGITNIQGADIDRLQDWMTTVPDPPALEK